MKRLSESIARHPWQWLLVAACLLSYANGLTGGFTYDDKAIVRDNPRIQSWANLPQILATHYFGGPLQTGTAYRPVDLLSLAANYAIHGKHTAGYHVVNVGLHLANTLLLFLLCRRKFGEKTAGPAALLFAVLPVHVEAVTSIVGRAEVLAAFLLLAAFVAAQRAQREGSGVRMVPYSGACVIYFLAVLTKESAAVFPGLLFLYDAISEQGGFYRRAWELLRRRALFYVGFALPLSATFAIRFLVLKGFLVSKFAGVFELENPLVSVTAFERAGNAALILLRQLGRIVFPFYLSGDESAWQLPLVTAHSALFWAGLCSVAVLAAAGLAGVSRRPPAGFGLLFFLLAALPTTNLLFVTGTIMAERLMYLPSAGIALAMASFVTPIGAASAALRRRSALLALVSVLFIVRSIVRNTVWQSDRALFSNLIETSPDSAKAHYDYAYEAADTRRPAQAYAQYRVATAIYAGYYDAWAGRGRMAGELGDLREQVADGRRAVEIFPEYENGWFTLAIGAERRGDFQTAEQAFRDGMRNCQSSYPLHYHWGAFLWRRGRIDEARRAYRQTIRVSDTALDHEDLGRILRVRGDSDGASDEWAEAVADFENDGVALAGLARIDEEEGDFAEAADFRLKLFEATRAREDLLLLLEDARQSPASARKVRGKWNEWAGHQPAMFRLPEVRMRLAALPGR